MNNEIKNKINQKIQLDEEIENLAWNALKRYADLGLDAAGAERWATDFQFDEDDLYFYRGNYDGYGNSSHNFYMPTRSLYDESYWEELEEKMKKDKAAEKRKDAAAAKRKERKEKEEYNRLKEKYENE